MVLDFQNCDHSSFPLEQPLKLVLNLTHAEATQMEDSSMWLSKANNPYKINKGTMPTTLNLVKTNIECRCHSDTGDFQILMHKFQNNRRIKWNKKCCRAFSNGC